MNKYVHLWHTRTVSKRASERNVREERREATKSFPREIQIAKRDQGGREVRSKD